MIEDVEEGGSLDVGSFRIHFLLLCPSASSPPLADFTNEIFLKVGTIGPHSCAYKARVLGPLTEDVATQQG